MDRTEKLKLQKMTVAAVAIAAALTMTACGSDDKTDSPTTTSKTTTTTTASDSTDAPVALLPTAPELNAKVAQALDETVPAADKVNLVQGAEADPELINQVAAAAKAAGAQVEILDPVTDTGSETAAASLNIVVNGQPLQQGLQASFVYEDGVWKLSKTTACQIVGVAGLTSPACAA
ncbi:hypothetical protein JCM9803A_13520 [Rhodococcus erythropolis]